MSVEWFVDVFLEKAVTLPVIRILYDLLGKVIEGIIFVLGGSIHLAKMEERNTILRGLLEAFNLTPQEFQLILEERYEEILEGGYPSNDLIHLKVVIKRISEGKSSLD